MRPPKSKKLHYTTDLKNYITRQIEVFPLMILVFKENSIFLKNYITRQIFKKLHYTTDGKALLERGFE